MRLHYGGKPGPALCAGRHPNLKVKFLPDVDKLQKGVDKKEAVLYPRIHVELIGYKESALTRCVRN